MEGAAAAVTAATGALGPVLAKLRALLVDGNSILDGRRETSEILSIKSELEAVYPLLMRLLEVEDDPGAAASKDWMGEARELFYDIEDTVEDYLLDLKRSSSENCGFTSTSTHTQQATRWLVRLCNLCRLFTVAAEIALDSVACGSCSAAHTQLQLQQSHPNRPLALDGNEPQDLKFLILFRDLKMKLKEVKRRCSEMWQETPEAISVSDRSKNKKPAVDPRARFLHKDASELVGMSRHKAKVMELLLAAGDEEGAASQKLKMVCIVGFAGMGKTTLADLVYQAIGEQFQCRAFASLSPSSSSSTMGFLNAILRQVSDTTIPSAGAGTEVSTEQYLIDHVSSVLADKRYLIIVDDIWHWEEWTVIGSAFPENFMGSKIILTTRVKALAEKCRSDAVIYELPGVHYYDAIKLTETAILKEKDYDTRDILAISLDELCRNIEYMSRGIPLALHCLSAEAADSVRQGNYDGWDTWIKHIHDGFLSIRILKPLADSLRLVYDSLPIHLKTCLLYCTTYLDFHSEKVLIEAQGMIERHDLVRKWKAEQFLSRLEAAETYFEELVSRNLLLAHPNGQRFYQIHPLMLPFLVCKSKQDNFVAHWLDDHGSAKRIRRLVIHQSYSVYDSGIYVPYSSMRRQHASISHVRSLVVCFRRSQHGPATMFDEEWRSIPSFKKLFPWFNNWSFKTLGHLRVLDLEQIVNIDNDDLVDICKLLLLRYLGLKCCSKITVLPPEIGRLQSLETLDISSTGVIDLPMEIGELRHLETMNVSNTRIRGIPREIGKVQHLKTLNLSTTRVIELPWENSLISSSLHVLAGDKNCPQLVKFSNGLRAIWIAWKNGTIASSAGAMRRQDLSIMVFDHFGSSSGPLPVPGLKVTSRHTNIPQWVKEHLTDVSSLDIRICRLEEEDLKFVQQMPNLQVLALRLEILPREPISITAGGFSKLESFLVDCRLPLVTFKQGAMPNLKHLEFKFYTGRASVHPIGITNLRNIQKVVFRCSNYYTSHGSGIAAMLEVVREETKEHPRRISLWINDSEVVFPEKGAEVSEENSIDAATGSSAECGIKTTLAASAIDHKGKAIQVSDYACASCSRTKIQEIVEAQE